MAEQTALLDTVREFGRRRLRIFSVGGVVFFAGLLLVLAGVSHRGSVVPGALTAAAGLATLAMAWVPPRVRGAVLTIVAFLLAAYLLAANATICPGLEGQFAPHLVLLLLHWLIAVVVLWIGLRLQYYRPQSRPGYVLCAVGAVGAISFLAHISLFLGSQGWVWRDFRILDELLDEGVLLAEYFVALAALAAAAALALANPPGRSPQRVAARARLAFKFLLLALICSPLGVFMLSLLVLAAAFVWLGGSGLPDTILMLYISAMPAVVILFPTVALTDLLVGGRRAPLHPDSIGIPDRG